SVSEKTGVISSPLVVTLVVSVCVHIVFPNRILQVKVNSVVPGVRLWAVVERLSGLVIILVGVDDQKVLTIASMVIGEAGVVKGTSKIDAVAAVQELSLIADEIGPEL